LRWAAAVAASLILSACPAPETEVVEKTAVEHGQDLFSDPTLSSAPGNHLACSDCHAPAASDDILTGAPLAGATGRARFWGGQEQTLLGAVNHCLYYFMLHDAPWTGDETEARAIYAYLESLPGPADPAPFTLGEVADPGAGDGARGEGIYRRACAGCHGLKSSGTGAKTPGAPVLPDETLAVHPLGEYTDAERRLVFVEKTRHGTFLGYGGQMPPFSLEVLSDQDLADMLAYLGVP
jgi:thiosulfate dehydrogenase